MTTKIISQKDSKTAWVVCLIATLFFFYTMIQLNLFNSIANNLIKEFRLSPGQLGQLSSMYFYANAIFLLPAGTLLDRFSTKKLILLWLTIMAAASLAFAFSNTFITAATTRFVVGLASTFSFLGSIRLASHWFSPRKMALVTGVIITFAMLGGLVAQTPFTLLSNHIGWRNALIVDSMFGIFLAAIILLVVKDYPDSHREHIKNTKAHLSSMGLWRSIKKAALNYNNWLAGLYTCSLNGAIFLMGALWGIDYLVNAKHLSRISASYVVTFLFLGVISGSSAFGWFSDHIGSRKIPMIMGTMLSLFVALTVIYTPHLSIAALIVLFFLIGFSSSAQIIGFPVIAELNPPALTATATSLASILIMGSGAVFQPLFGWLLQLNWQHVVIGGQVYYAAENFKTAMMIIPVSAIIAFITCLMIKETHCKPIAGD